MQSVCVFTGSSSGDSAAFHQAATALGNEIARRNMTLVYGGATVGLMGRVADAVIAKDGQVIGVLPKALAELEIAHEGLDELVLVDSMHERKQLMADRADAFVALPGGLGTLEEIFEIWTWAQLGIHAKPLGFLNIAGYYDHLFAFLDNAVSAGFMKQAHRARALMHTEPDQLLDLFKSADTRYEPKWIDR